MEKFSFRELQQKIKDLNLGPVSGKGIILRYLKKKKNKKKKKMVKAQQVQVQ